MKLKATKHQHQTLDKTREKNYNDQKSCRMNHPFHSISAAQWVGHIFFLFQQQNFCLPALLNGWEKKDLSDVTFSSVAVFAKYFRLDILPNNSESCIAVFSENNSSLVVLGVTAAIIESLQSAQLKMMTMIK